MPSLAEVLRKACKANGLGTTGSSAVMIKRLVSTSKPKTSSNKKMIKKKKNVTCKGGVCKPKATSPIKISKKGRRLSASYYFHEVCDGKISRCKPQVIQEPSGRCRLKQIKIVNGANGKHPRWVLVD